MKKSGDHGEVESMRALVLSALAECEEVERRRTQRPPPNRKDWPPVVEAWTPGDCTICLQRYDRGKKVAQWRGCRHCFHPRCLEKWLKAGAAGTACPMCRAPLRPHKVESSSESAGKFGATAVE